MERMTGIEPVLPAWQAGVRTTIRHPHYSLSMEQMMGVEPTPSVWKTDILAAIRHLHASKRSACFPSL